MFERAPVLVRRLSLRHRALRALSALFLAALIAVPLGQLQAQPVQASFPAFGNLIPTNEIGEPVDESFPIASNENLWAYVTAPTGGAICAVGYQSPGPIIGGLFDCPGEGWGHGFAPPLFAGLVPVAPARLRVGTWILVGTAPDLHGVSKIVATSQPFRVAGCQGDCSKAPPPDPSAAKAAMRAINDSMKLMCQGAKALNFAKRLRDFRNKYDQLVVDPAGGGWGVFITSVAVDVGENLIIGGVKPNIQQPIAFLPSAVGWGIWATCKSYFGADFPNSPIPFVSGDGVNVPGPLVSVNAWLNDPPKPYETVAVADPIDWARIDLTGFDAGALVIAEPMDELRAYLSAGTTSYERLLGALADGPAAAEFVHLQSFALATNFDGLKASMASLAGQLDAAAAAILADPEWPDQILEEDIADSGPVLRRIRDIGFSSDEIQQMQNLGISDGSIVQLRDQLGGDTDALAGGMTFHGALEGLARDIRAAVPALDDFATQAVAFAMDTEINEAPLPSFSATPTTGAAPLSVSFDATASSDANGDGLSFSWSFGDGTTGTGVAPSHTYVGAGSYTATLAVDDGQVTAITSMAITVTGNHAPVANPDFADTYPNTPVTTNVLANDTDADGDPLTITGSDDGAGGSVSCAVSSCTYTPGAVFGTDFYHYTIGDGHGGTVTATVRVTISPSGSPSADFTITPPTGDGPLQVTLDGRVSSDPGGQVVAWAWDLGDGTTATGPTVVHTFPAGTYRIGLVVTDDQGNQNGPSVRNLSVTQAGNALPFVEVSASPTSGTGSVSAFLGVTAFDPDGSIQLLHWDFDDGTTFDGPPGPASTQSHTWSTPGTYTVVVTATDDAGGEASDFVGIEVFAPANQAPTVSEQTYQLLKGESTQVDALETASDPDGDPLTIRVTIPPAFGAGSCAANGSCDYTASLTTTQEDRIGYVVEDGHGHSVFNWLIFNVSKQAGAPTAALSIQPNIGITPLVTAFDGSASFDGQGDIVDYEWSVDSVVVGHGPILNYTFENPGRDTQVVLRVEDEQGLLDWAAKNVDARDRHLLGLPYCGDMDDLTLVQRCLEYDIAPTVQLYRVGGEGPATLTFDYILRGGGLGNELVLFEVDDAIGRINGHLPGTTEWFGGVLDRGQTLFPAFSDHFFPDIALPVNGGDLFAFVLIPNQTLEAARSTPNWWQSAFFSIDAINYDDADHFAGLRHRDGGLFEFALEDLFGGGDRDYDDVVYTVSGNLEQVPALVLGKSVAEPVTTAGAADAYTIHASNTSPFPVVLDEIVDDLPPGFAYVPGSTTGVTSADPSDAAGTLTWTGPFVIPSLGELSLSFSVTVADTPGTYYNDASVTASNLAIAPTGPTAPVLVVAPLPGDLPPVVDAGPNGAGSLGTPIALDGTVIDQAQVVHPTLWTWQPLAGVDPGATCDFVDETAVDTDVSCSSPGSYTMTLTADDDGTPVADTATIRVYGELGGELTLDPIADEVVDEGETVSVTASAHGPAGASFSIQGCPVGASISAGPGVFSWPTGEADGPGNYPCTVVATAGSETASRRFSIHVNEVNLDPVLIPPPDVTVEAGETATGQASANDPDLPANTLTYSLVASPGAIGGSSGAFSWVTGAGDVGDHTITVRVEDGAGGSDEATFVVHVTARVVPTSLGLGGDDAGQYSDRATISARLTTGGVAIAGATVQLQLGVASQFVTTDAQGWASVTFPILGPATTIARAAAFAGDATHEGSTASGTFDVQREDAVIELPGGDAVAAGSTVTLRAVLRDSASAGYAGLNPETGLSATIGDITKLRVLFEVYLAASCLTGSPIRTFSANAVDEAPSGDGIGWASATWTNVAEGSYCIAARLIGGTASQPNDWYVAPQPEPIGLGVFKPATGHVTGGGWLALPNGERLNFGFNALADKKGAKGQLMVVARTDCGAEPSRLLAKSNAFTSLVTDGQVNPTTAVLTGKAVLRCLAMDDGALLWENGNATWTATAVDGGQRASDAFGIRVTESAGRIVLDVAVTTLRGGSIVAHLR